MALAVATPLMNINEVALLDVPFSVTAPLVLTPPSNRAALSLVFVPSPQRVNVVPVAEVRLRPPQAKRAFVPPVVVTPLIWLSPLVPVVVTELVPLNTTP